MTFTCRTVNRGTYVHSLVLTDIASGWTACAPLVVREGGFVVETIERLRLGLPFGLRALSSSDLRTYRLSDKLRGRCRRILEEHWSEMTAWLEAHPDQTALELLIEFQGRYAQGQLHTLHRDTCGSGGIRKFNG